MRRRQRRQRAPTAWVVSTLGYGGVNTAIAGTPFPLALMGTDAGQAFNPPSMDRFRVERVIGDITYQMAQSAVAINITAWRWGIIVVKTSGGGIAFSTPSPANLQDGNSSWLWLGTAQRFASLAPTGYGPHMEIHVDARVRRVIRADEQLRLVALQDNTGNVSLNFTPWLRTLISRVA